MHLDCYNKQNVFQGKKTERLLSKCCINVLIPIFFMSYLNLWSAEYSNIDRKVTRSENPYGSAWSTDYGYNQSYPLDILADVDCNGTNYNWLPAYHAGIDISVPNGTTLYSLSFGQVTRIKSTIGGVYIRTPQGGTLVYMHLSRIDVSEGDAVDPDTVLGLSGNQGTGSAHLHIEWLRDESENPSEVSFSNTGTQLEWENDIVGGTLIGATQAISIPTLTYDLQSLNLIHAEPIGPIDTGDIKITGVGFGNSVGTIEITLYNPTESAAVFTSEELSTPINPTISNDDWEDMEIRLNIFEAPLTHDKFVMPIRILIQDETSQVVASIYYPFQDVHHNVWYAEYVTKIWKRGVISGQADSDYFKPDSDCNRAEFIKIAVLSYGQRSTSTEDPPYPDVKVDDWFYPYVKIAWNLGWLEYNEDNTNFRPGDPINRAESAKVVSIAANFQDVIESSVFVDVELTDWFAQYVMRLALYDRGIVVGFNENGQRLFKPGNNIIRSEVVKIVEKTFHSEDY